MVRRSTRTICQPRRVRTCASTRTIRSSGIRGVPKRSNERARRKEAHSPQCRLQRLPLVHVLHEESFEDEATARILNDYFVNIKVDREERPDIDRIYQIAQQMLTQRGGGWPLTMFLTHDDQRPFFGGTYFPKEARYGLPAFSDILQRVAEYYRRARAPSCAQQNDALMAAFAALAPPAAASRHRAAPMRRSQPAGRSWRAVSTRATAASAAHRSFRTRSTIEWLLRTWQRERERARARPAGALHGDAHPAAHGRRRHQRSAGRRLLPLLGR